MRTRTLLATSTAALSLAGLSALGGGGFAGAATQIGLSITNASATDKFTNNEITIAVNPHDNQNLVIGDNDYANNDGCGVNASFDGGKTWGTHSFIPHITKVDDDNNPTDGQFDFAGDPAVAFRYNGTAYFACYGYAVHGSLNSVALFVSTSTDGGRTWSRHPAQVTSCDCNGVGKGAGGGGTGQFPDHEAITVDNWASSPHRGRIYVTQAQFHGNGGPSPIEVFWSDDGTHWSKPIEVSHSPNNSNQDGIATVGPDGSVYVTFDNEHGGIGGTSYQQSVFIAKSTDGGQSFGPNYKVVDWVDPVASDLPNSEYRAGSYPVPGIDSHNRLTVVWNDRRDGPSQVYAQRINAADIANGANAWTTPLRLHQSTKEQFFPWLSVAGNDRVDIIYYDRTADRNNFLNFVTYTALTPTATTGLGVSNFTKAITPATSSNGFDGSLETGQTTTSCGPFIGDYIGVASTTADVYLGWSDNGGRNNSDPLGNALGCDVNQDDFSAHLTY